MASWPCSCTGVRHASRRVPDMEPVQRDTVVPGLVAFTEQGYQGTMGSSAGRADNCRRSTV